MQFILTGAIKQNRKAQLLLVLSQLNLKFLLNYTTTQAQEIRLK